MGISSMRHQTHRALKAIEQMGCSKYEAKVEQAWKPGQPVAGIFSYGTFNTVFNRAMTVAHWLEVHYPNLRLWREVDHEILTEFLAEKQETCATSTMRTYLAELEKFQEGLYAIHWITDDIVPPWPVEGVDLPRGPYALAEAAAIEQWVAMRRADYGLATRVILSTGARISEVHHLRADKVFADEGCVELLGKGGKLRTIDVLDSAVLRQLEFTPAGYAFLDMEHDPHWKDNLERYVRRACDDLAIQRRGVHGLRGTAAGVFLDKQIMAGLSEQRGRRELTQWLGHNAQRVEVTYAYVPRRLCLPEQQLEVAGCARQR